MAGKDQDSLLVLGGGWKYAWLDQFALEVCLIQIDVFPQKTGQMKSYFQRTLGANI